MTDRREKLSPTDKAAARASAREQKQSRREEKIAVKQEKTKKIAAEKAAKIRAERERYGRKVVSERIPSGLWFTRVEMFDKGFVKMGGRYSRLKRISGNFAIQKRKGGLIHMTIVTNLGPRAFSTDQASDAVVRSYQKLITTGESLLVANTDEKTSSDVKHDTSADLPSQLEKLAQLNASGTLSNEEFRAAKSKLLGSP